MNRFEHPRQKALPVMGALSFARPSYWFLKAVLSVYVGVSLIDPMDQMFHLKSILFLTVFAVWFFRAGLGYTKWCRPSDWAALTALALVIPIAATLIGLLSGRNPPSGPTFSTIEMFLMLFLVLVVASEDIDLVSILNRECIVVAFITLCIAITSIVSPLLYEAIYEFTAMKQTAFLSLEASHVGLGIGSFYYKTSATMILPLGYYTVCFYARRSHRVRSLFLALVYFSALVLSGARANTLAAAAVVGVFSIKKIREVLGWNVAMPVSLVVLAFAAGSFLPKFFNPTEYSNAVKLGHWSSYIAEFEQHPSYLFWGEGADTEFYSKGFEKKTTITELTYLELVRNFGIPITLLFFMALFWPLIPLLGRRARDTGISYLAVPYGVYLLMSASNPLLLNTTGMLVVISAWGAALTLYRKNISPHIVEITNYSLHAM
jgi:hypothetical protein